MAPARVAPPLGPDMDVPPNACSQMDVPTVSKQILIQAVMELDDGYDYDTAVTMLENCDGNVARVAERLRQLKISDTNDKDVSGNEPKLIHLAPPCSSFSNPYIDSRLYIVFKFMHID